MLNYWEMGFNILGFAGLMANKVDIFPKKKLSSLDVVTFCLTCPMVFEWIFIWLIKMYFFCWICFSHNKISLSKKGKFILVLKYIPAWKWINALLFPWGGNTMSSCFCVFTDVIVFFPGCEPPLPCFVAMCLHRLKLKIRENITIAEISLAYIFSFSNFVDSKSKCLEHACVECLCSYPKGHLEQYKHCFCFLYPGGGHKAIIGLVKQSQVILLTFVSFPYDSYS